MGTLLSNGSGIVVCLWSCSLATGMFAESFPYNGCVCWLHSSCFEQICHNIYVTDFSKFLKILFELMNMMNPRVKVTGMPRFIKLLFKTIYWFWVLFAGLRPSIAWMCAVLPAFQRYMQGWSMLCVFISAWVFVPIEPGWGDVRAGAWSLGQWGQWTGKNWLWNSPF
jgi:hypothetical protein